MSIPVELLEGPVRDVAGPAVAGKDGPAVAGKDGPAAMNEVVQEILLVAHPLCLALRLLPRTLLLDDLSHVYDIVVDSVCKFRVVTQGVVRRTR